MAVFNLIRVGELSFLFGPLYFFRIYRVLLFVHALKGQISIFPLVISVSLLMIHLILFVLHLNMSFLPDKLILLIVHISILMLVYIFNIYGPMFFLNFQQLFVSILYFRDHYSHHHLLC